MVVVYGRQGVGGSIICYLVSTASRLGVWKVIFIYLQNYLALSVRTGPLIQRVWVMRLHFHEGDKRTTGRVAKKKNAMSGRSDDDDYGLSVLVTILD